MPEIVRWARGPMAALTAGCLDDPRVTVVEDDVARSIAAGRSAFDNHIRALKKISAGFDILDTTESGS